MNNQQCLLPFFPCDCLGCLCVSQVSVVRCRQVTKPGGAKPGLVHLNGDILTVKIDVKAETKRGERLEKDRPTS